MNNENQTVPTEFVEFSETEYEKAQDSQFGFFWEELSFWPIAGSNFESFNDFEGVGF